MDNFHIGFHKWDKKTYNELKNSCQNILKIKEIEIQQKNHIEAHFKLGEKVKVIKGLYQGIEAIYQMDDGLERAIVLLSILNKKTPLNLNKNQLQKI